MGLFAKQATIASSMRTAVGEYLMAALTAKYPEPHRIAELREDAVVFDLAQSLQDPRPNQPPLVPSTHVYLMVELIDHLTKFQAKGDINLTFSHNWGTVKLEPDGFRLADPHQPNAQGNWRSDNVPALAQEMYEGHLRRCGLIDN